MAGAGVVSPWGWVPLPACGAGGAGPLAKDFGKAVGLLVSPHLGTVVMCAPLKAWSGLPIKLVQQHPFHGAGFNHAGNSLDATAVAPRVVSCVGRVRADAGGCPPPSGT